MSLNHSHCSVLCILSQTVHVIPFVLPATSLYFLICFLILSICIPHLGPRFGSIRIVLGSLSLVAFLPCLLRYPLSSFLFPFSRYLLTCNQIVIFDFTPLLFYSVSLLVGRWSAPLSSLASSSPSSIYKDSNLFWSLIAKVHLRSPSLSFLVL